MTRDELLDALYLDGQQEDDSVIVQLPDGTRWNVVACDNGPTLAVLRTEPVTVP